jgi:hypothetical protein
MALLSAITKAVDELVQLGYPREVAERIVSGDLPMDTASRMQRAEAMGFDPSDVQYHGTKAYFTEFAPSEFGNVGPGIYMSTNPEVASGYASRNLYNPEEGAQVMPLITRGETIGMRDYFAQYPDTAISQMPDTNAELRERGITAINEAAGAPDKAVFDPRDIRSLFSAAFDPEYKGSNILGGAATAAVGAGLLATPEEAEAGVVKTFGRAFDPRFDPRVKEQEKLRDTTFTIEERGTQDAPRIPLADLEGRPFVTTMSDRTQAGGLLTGIDDVALDRPINLQGGQGFMFENPGMVWASAPGVVNQIMRAASEVGDNPVYLPFRMAPTGGDFATMTGETMLSFASSNMNKTQKKALDQAIKDYESVGSMVKGKRVGAGLKIKDWKGVDDPSSVEVWRNTPDTLRKELMNMMDVQFRDKGGLSVGQARLAVTEPGQADALDAQIQNIGEIFTGKDVVQASGHPSYPAGVPGQGLGRTDQEVGIFELLTDARFGGQQKPVGDPQKPTAQEIRALQMKPYTGRITEDILRGLETRGVNVNANPMVTAAAVAAGQEAEGLLAQLPQKDLEAYNYSDVLPVKRSKDPEEREGLLGGYSPAYTGIVEDMVEGLLKFSTQAKRGIYNPTAATEFLL